MNQLTYLYFAGAGLLFCLVFTHRLIFGDLETINWWVWSVGAIVYFVVVVWAWRRFQRVLFGTSMIINITKYVPPSTCPLCLQLGTEARAVSFNSTMAGPLPIVQRAYFPVKLCATCAERFDASLLKNVKGVRIGRVAYENLTIQIKRPSYLAAVTEANRETGAIDDKK